LGRTGELQTKTSNKEAANRDPILSIHSEHPHKDQRIKIGKKEKKSIQYGCIPIKKSIKLGSMSTPCQPASL